MILHEKTAQAEQGISLAQRHAYLQLPLEERRKRLAAQAAQMVDYYEQEPERTERIVWQGGDIIEP